MSTAQHKNCYCFTISYLLSARTWTDIGDTGKAVVGCLVWPALVGLPAAPVVLEVRMRRIRHLAMS